MITLLVAIGSLDKVINERKALDNDGFQFPALKTRFRINT